MTAADLSAETRERNRRESYRINDRVALAVQPLSESEYRTAKGNALARLEERRLLNSIIATGEAQRGALRNIRDSEPAIAAYLQSLEERLERLARMLSRDRHGAPDDPSHDVNISGNGIRFHHTKELAKGTRVALELQLFPSRTCLGVMGTVVRCRRLERTPLHGGRYVVAVDFTDIHDDDRELLISHVHGLQLDYARRGVLRT